MIPVGTSGLVERGVVIWEHGPVGVSSVLGPGGVFWVSVTDGVTYVRGPSLSIWVCCPIGDPGSMVESGRRLGQCSGRGFFYGRRFE